MKTSLVSALTIAATLALTSVAQAQTNPVFPGLGSLPGMGTTTGSLPTMPNLPSLPGMGTLPITLPGGTLPGTGTTTPNKAAARKADFEGFVTLANGQKVYTVEYKARNGAPTVVLLHGLTYTMKPWQAMVANFSQSDLGVLLYDMRGMGKTLEETGPAKDVIALDKQVEDLDYLLRDRGLDRVTLAGLSYGGAVGIAYAQAHPERVANLVLMAPFVKALKQQDDMIKQRIQMFRLMNPRDKRTDDELYETFLRDIIYQTYPLYEPVVKEHPWRLEAVYQMVRGVRKFLGAEAVKTMAAIPVHLIQGAKDQYVPAQDLNEFWAALRADQKASRIIVRGSEHKLPEAVPNFVSAWISHIQANDPAIAGGREFDGNPTQGTAVSKDAKVEGLGVDKVRPFGLMF